MEENTKLTKSCLVPNVISYSLNDKLSLREIAKVIAAMPDSYTLDSYHINPDDMQLYIMLVDDRDDENAKSVYIKFEKNRIMFHNMCHKKAALLFEKIMTDAGRV